MDFTEARSILGRRMPSGAPLWSQFVGAVNDPQLRATPGGVVQYVWASVTAAYAASGEPLPQGAFQAVNSLMSLAGQQRQAQINLSTSLALQERTGLGQSLSASHVAPGIDAQAPHLQTLGPQYRVSFLSQEIVGGEPVLSYRTHDLGYDLPASLDGLQETIDMSADILAADYGYEWAGVATPIGIQSY